MRQISKSANHRRIALRTNPAALARRPTPAGEAGRARMWIATSPVEEEVAVEVGGEMGTDLATALLRPEGIETAMMTDIGRDRARARRATEEADQGVGGSGLRARKGMSKTISRSRDEQQETCLTARSSFLTH